MKSKKIFDDETGLETGVELVAQHIERISATLSKIESSRATRKLIVALLNDDTRLGKSQIDLILDSLESLERKYLKPKKGPRKE